MTISSVMNIPYGCEGLGKLTRVLLHRPGKELELINRENHHQWLFDSVPDIDAFIEEHDRYRELLTSLGVEVFELSDYVQENKKLIAQKPNLTYLHDTAVISRHGAILSSMAWESRRKEETIVKEALTNLGIPIYLEFADPEDAFEGCLLISPETVLVAETERHTRSAIRSFVRKILSRFKEVVYVDIPKARRYMHPDTIYNRMSKSLALAYLPVFQKTYLFSKKGIDKINFEDYMKRKGVEIVPVSNSEQLRLACSFVPLCSGVIIHYDTSLDSATKALLAKKGIEIISFHPKALIAGGGSLRCLTLRLHREC